MAGLSKVVIVDYGSGNIRSAAKAFEAVIAAGALSAQVLVSDNPQDVSTADYVVLPGQGAFWDCMQGLSAVSGMIGALEEVVLEKKKPFLGICVGMQLLATRGLEFGNHDGLGWIAGEVVPIVPADKNLKIPHMGWNTLKIKDNSSHPVLQDLSGTDPHFYFVHSFMFESEDNEHVLAQTDYGGPVTAVVAKANIVGVQFHPEKSHNAGLNLLRNFLLWNPSETR